MQMHYLNATANAITAQVTIRFHKATPGTITQHAGVFFFNNAFGIQVPGGATQDVTQSCPFPKAVNVISTVAHTHKFTNTFTASVGGMQIYNTTSWDASPIQTYMPPLAVASGQ